MDYSKATAILLGGKWLQVSNGKECEDEVSFDIGFTQKMIAKKAAIDAVKITYHPLNSVERYEVI